MRCIDNLYLDLHKEGLLEVDIWVLVHMLAFLFSCQNHM
jgi:hypothetical protein